MSGFAATFALLLGGVLSAQTQPAAPVANACSAEIARFCPQVDVSDLRSMMCLRDHADQVSAECAPVCDKLTALFESIRESCSEDIGQFCQDVDDRELTLLKCLRRNKDRLSSPCMQTRDPGKRVFDQAHRDCKRELKAICPQRAERDDTTRCLRDHNDDLSAGCRRAVMGGRKRRPTR